MRSSTTSSCAHSRRPGPLASASPRACGRRRTGSPCSGSPRRRRFAGSIPSRPPPKTRAPRRRLHRPGLSSVRACGRRRPSRLWKRLRARRYHDRYRARAAVSRANPSRRGRRRRAVSLPRGRRRAPSARLTRSATASRGVSAGEARRRRFLRPCSNDVGRMCAVVTNSVGGVRVAERLGVGVAARLSRYLQVLAQAKKMGKDRISSQEIAEYTNINATQIRRDLSGFGKFGKRGVGYSVDSLLAEIRKILRTQGQHNIALVGAGRLGAAIASSPIFAEHGITIAAVFDNDDAKVGTSLGGVRVSSLDELDAIARDRSIVVGVLAVPDESAQDAADRLVEAGVKIVFNYSTALIDTPSDVQVHTSNPAVELLYALYFHLT